MREEKRKARTYLTCQIDIRDKAMQRHFVSVWRMFEASAKVIVRNGSSKTRNVYFFPLLSNVSDMYVSNSFPEDRVCGNFK